MKSFPNNRMAGAGPSRARRLRAVLSAALALALALPALSWGSLSSEIKSLPGDVSPKEACEVLIKNKVVKPAKDRACRELIAEGFAAAKEVASSSHVTIAAATACTSVIFEGKLKASEMKHCSRKVAESATKKEEAGSKDSGGGGFDPLGAAGDFLGGAVDTVTGAVGGAVTGTILDGFKAIIGLLFGGLQSAITVALVKWITTIPNLSDGHVGSLEASIAVGAGGLLAATMTISIVRFWGAGLTGDGAWAGAEGVVRAAVAAALIGLWPQIFDLAVRLANALQKGILGHGVEAQLKALFRDLDVIGLSGGALTGGAIPMFLAIVIAIVGILMLLALVAMKIVITALTIVLFCAMPLALVIWPIPELAGVARFCLRSLGMVLAIPVVWCLIFGAFAAIGADTFSFHNTGKDEGIFGTALDVAVVRPLVAISLLYLALVMPRRLLQLAPFMGGGGGGGMMRSLATGATLRAGFHYAPQVAKGASSGWGGGDSQTQVSSTSSRVEKAAGKGAQAFRGTTDGAAAKGKALVDKLPGQSSQAPKGTGRQEGPAQQKGADSAAGQGARPAAEKAGQKGEGGAQKAPDAKGAGESKLRLAGGKFNGPLTVDPHPEHQGDISKARGAMKESHKAGGSSPAQVDRAIGDLHSKPEYLEAARRASVLKEPTQEAKQANGAFAEWSISDNPEVSDTERNAFKVLGHATPQQRQDGFKRLDGTGGSAAPSTPGSSAHRTVPPPAVGPSERTSSPSTRTPHRQPGTKGED